MNRRQLDIILNAHKIWLESEGQQGMRADLQGADLTGMDLRRANLQRADLRSACLQGANLQEANLQEADLSGADLMDADLRIAYLRLSSLRSADFSRANLRGADLWVADLSGANLQEANLREANLQEANLEGANLMGANFKFVKLTTSTYRQIPNNIKNIFKNHWHVIGSDEPLEVEQSLELPFIRREQIAAAMKKFASVLLERTQDQQGIVRIIFNGEKIILSLEPANDAIEIIDHPILNVSDKPTSHGGFDINLTDEQSSGNEDTSTQNQDTLRLQIEEFSIGEKLKQLVQLHHEGLITTQEFNQKKTSLLDQL